MVENMDLIKDNWTAQDVKDFQNWEFELKGDEYNCKWEQRIVNTALECFARTSEKLKLLQNKFRKTTFIVFWI